MQHTVCGVAQQGLLGGGGEEAASTSAPHPMLIPLLTTIVLAKAPVRSDLSYKPLHRGADWAAVEAETDLGTAFNRMLCGSAADEVSKHRALRIWFECKHAAGAAGAPSLNPYQPPLLCCLSGHRAG